MIVRRSDLLRGAAIVIVAGLLAGPALADTRIGVMGPIQPQTSDSAPNGAMQAAAPAEDVRVEEKILTDAAGQADILLLDRSSVRIGPNTEMVIDEYSFSPQTGSGKLAMSADKGTLRFSGGDLSKQANQVSMRTPTAILGVRGGIILVQIDKGGATTATFLYGKELTITSTGGAVVHITKPGYFSVVPADGSSPSTPQRATPALIRAAIANLDSSSKGNGVLEILDSKSTAASVKKALAADSVTASVSSVGTSNTLSGVGGKASGEKPTKPVFKVK